MIDGERSSVHLSADLVRVLLKGSDGEKRDIHPGPEWLSFSGPCTELDLSNSRSICPLGSPSCGKRKPHGHHLPH